MLEILTASVKNSMCNMENIDFIQKKMNPVLRRR